ncbi:MAG: S8 family serine peptidase [bacterium]|nr:S8 family serine peptidase [bacterium]
MKYKVKTFLLLILTLIVVFVGVLLVKNNLFKNKDDDLINISYLSQDFMDNYFEEISNADSDEEKENMLIIISDSKIKDSYGAKNIIEAPNNQYILQYESEEEKNKALEKLENDKSIASVEKNEVRQIEEVTYNSWGINKMSLDYAIDNSNIDNLEEVTVAIIDTGLDVSLFNKYYGGRLAGYYNVLEQSNTIMNDTNGHGTHVAGTIAEGTPSNVKILPIKVSTNGTLYTTDIIASINYITIDKKADVINMSFGGYGKSEAEEQAIEAAKQKNIISVAAAGNDNTSKDHYPSSFDNTIAISSVDSQLKKSSFSNYGSKVTFAAPGTNIKSIMGKDASISKRNGNNDDDDHEIISGTSMATPHAVAAVAVLKGYNKNLTLDNVIDILKSNSIDLGEEGWDQYYGYGLISFKDVEFCDGRYCDELGVYKDLNKNISSFEVTNLNFTPYNYYSITNLMGSKVNAIYNDSTSEELLISNLPNVEILNYDPTATGSQTITIKSESLEIDIQVTNPEYYESGWEYNTLENGNIEITGYKNHNLGIERLYVPETIDSKQVVSFADNFKFAESGTDIESYIYLYLPSTFTRIGNYSLSNTNIKYIYGADNKVEVGAHAFENSEIVSIDIPIIKIEDYAFKDCFGLVSIEVWKEKNDYLVIGNYAFYNCKKLTSVKMTNDEADKLVDTIGNYAFYNCISLSHFDLKPSSIGDYSFYNTFSLSIINLYSSASIGQYAFYGSGILEVNFSYNLEVINESAFENCKRLEYVGFNTGRIEKKAFWASGIETISISDRLEYIAEDAFAYTPMKSSSNGGNQGTGNYKAVYNLGIVELSTNKLIIGFTDAIGASNTMITEDITEIGNYAFTGNNNLNKITIPANVTKIGAHAFEDCYQLSDVYMLGNTINFENDTFKRNYVGEIQGADLKIYVYKESAIKQEVIDKGLNYRNIEPDEIIVTNYENSYKALSQVDFRNLSVKLIYHEEEDREEVLNTLNNSTFAPISNGVGFDVSYQTENAYNFTYGDTYFIVKAKNAIGYLSTKNVEVTIEKETPRYTIPTGLTAQYGQQLSEIELPSNFKWMDENQIITGFGEVTYKAKYISSDTNNYEIVQNIDITITVSNGKTIINPEIIVENKTYDGTTSILPSSIRVSNLENLEYSVVSAVSSNADVGERVATVILKLSNEKFENYCFSNGNQEKEFTIDFEILKATINVSDTSKDVTVKYDGQQHSIEMHLDYNQNAILKFMDENKEYKLDEVPKYTDVGTYVIKYKVYINENYTEYFGQKTLTIEDENPYVINKYDVDETNKYINKIIVNTEINDFISSIVLSNGYGIDVDTKEVNSKRILYTGGKTRIKKGLDLYREYINIVIGDINGDGAINSADLLKVRQHLLSINILSGAYYLSSDINYDNSINSADLLRVRQHLLGTKLIE